MTVSYSPNPDSDVTVVLRGVLQVKVLNNIGSLPKRYCIVKSGGTNVVVYPYQIKRIEINNIKLK